MNQANNSTKFEWDKDFAISRHLVDPYVMTPDILEQVRLIQEKWVWLFYGGKGRVKKYDTFNKETWAYTLSNENSLPGAIIKGGWDNMYLISNISEVAKFSFGYFDCMGIVVTGLDESTGENISFMTHQKPSYVAKHKDEFTADLTSALQEMKSRCSPGSISAVIFGGQDENLKLTKYEQSIKHLSTLITEKLSLSPEVILGPSIQSIDPTNVLFDTKTRTIYFLRVEQDVPKSNESFPSAQLTAYMEGIKKEVREIME